MRRYKTMTDRGEAPDFFMDEEKQVAECTCHDVVALLKQYIRELPEPIVPSAIDAEMHAIIGTRLGGGTGMRCILEFFSEIFFLFYTASFFYYI
jgi:hypothetical protein